MFQRRQQTTTAGGVPQCPVPAGSTASLLTDKSDIKIASLEAKTATVGVLEVHDAVSGALQTQTLSAEKATITVLSATDINAKTGCFSTVETKTLSVENPIERLAVGALSAETASAASIQTHTIKTDQIAVADQLSLGDWVAQPTPTGDINWFKGQALMMVLSSE
jgi:hypothetical protein